MRRLTLLLVLVVSSLRLFAMNYEDARNYAWYLTDKMAYELNLTPDQYDMVYEINMEYFLSVNRRRDITGDYWYYRNLDFQNVLYDWQYSLYRTFEYFYRPLLWRSSRFVFCPYTHYHRDYYYFARPVIYGTYIGGCWHGRSRHTPSPYRGMFFTPGGGMRDRWNNHSSHHSGHHTPAPQPNRNHNYGSNRPGYRNDNNGNGHNSGGNKGHGNNNGGHDSNPNRGNTHQSSVVGAQTTTGGRGGNSAAPRTSTERTQSAQSTTSRQPSAPRQATLNNTANSNSFSTQSSRTSTTTVGNQSSRPTTTTVTRQPSLRTNQASGFSGTRQSVSGSSTRNSTTGTSRVSGTSTRSSSSSSSRVSGTSSRSSSSSSSRTTTSSTGRSNRSFGR